jgi:hypothetical protein
VIPEPATTPWLRRARWAVAVAAVACLAAGLIWVYRCAVAGKVLEGVAGGALCLGVIALDRAAGAVLRLAGLVLRCARRLDSLESRLAAMEVALEADTESADWAAIGKENAEALIAARLDRDTFPRLVNSASRDGRATEAHRPDSAAAKVTASQRQLEELARRELVRLRNEFADQVRKGDYAAAMRTGERIVALFPESDLATQFQTLRKHLLRRASGAAPDEHASVV